MNNTTGLLTQKPDSPAPQVGQQRRFTVMQKQGKSGKPYTKLKAEGEGYGQLYEVVSVEKTDFVDNYGNVSFSVGYKPVNGANGHAETAAPASRNGGYSRDPATQARIERQHSQHMTLLYFQLKGQLPANWSEFASVVSLFQLDIGKSPEVTAPKPEPAPENAGEEERPLIW